jgi:hypothetical protein
MSKKILIEQCKDCKNNKKRYIFTFKSNNKGMYYNRYPALTDEELKKELAYYADEANYADKLISYKSL